MSQQQGWQWHAGCSQEDDLTLKASYSAPLVGDCRLSIVEAASHAVHRLPELGLAHGSVFWIPDQASQAYSQRAEESCCTEYGLKIFHQIPVNDSLNFHFQLVYARHRSHGPFVDPDHPLVRSPTLSKRHLLVSLTACLSGFYPRDTDKLSKSDVVATPVTHVHPL